MSEFLAHDESNKNVHSDLSHNNVNYSSLNSPVEQRKTNGKVLLICLVITFVFSLLEGFSGWYIKSIALQSDAVHMMTDAAGLLIAFIANYVAKRPANTTLTFGYGKAEALGALVNCLFTLFLTLWLLIEVLARLFEPVSVNGIILFIIAGVGFLVNGVIVLILSKNANSLNLKAAMIHAIGDLLGSLVAIIAGLIIYYTGYSIFDPILSLVVIVLLLISNYHLIKKSSRVLLSGVPEYLDYEQVGRDICDIDGIVAVHDLHIWYISANQAALAAHVVACNLSRWPEILDNAQKMLLKDYAIEHITLQAEFDDAKCRELNCCD